MEPQRRQLADLLKSCQKIVVLSGAVHCNNLTLKNSLGCVQQTAEENLEFCESQKSILNQSLSEDAPVSQVHLFLDELARRGQLMRHYTQNVDCLELQYPSLEKKTVRLHGRVDQARCVICNWTCPIKPEILNGAKPQCRGTCADRALERHKQGKRMIQMGFLCPDVLLHGADAPHEEYILRCLREDESERPDLFIVVGTRLRISGARMIVKVLGNQMIKTGKTSAWVNKLHKPTHKRWFNHTFIGDCDEIFTGDVI